MFRQVLVVRLVIIFASVLDLVGLGSLGRGTMDEDKSQVPGTGGFHGSFSHSWNVYNLKSEPSPSSSSSSQLPPMPPHLGQAGSSSGSGPEPGHFSHDLSRMHDNPPRNLGHRRAHSEILTLPDDLSFDSDLGVVGGAADGPSLSDETEEDLFSMYLDMDKLNSSAVSSFQVGEHSSAPVSAGHVVAGPGSSMGSGNTSSEALSAGPSEKPRVRHQHSQSMDGSTSIKPEMLMSGSEDPSAADSKKAMAAAKLAELALIDPKRAKRYSIFHC